MARVHEILRWANKRDVAREVTRRGYRLSGEALNQWVREEKEFPAIVRDIVFNLFTIEGYEENPPASAEGLDGLEGLVRAIGLKSGLTESEMDEAVELHRAVRAAERSRKRNAADPPPAGQRPAGT